MAAIFGIIPVPYLDNKQTQALVAGLVVAGAYMYNEQLMQMFQKGMDTVVATGVRR